MCGRFGLTRPDKLDLQRFGLAEAPSQAPRFNVPPGGDVLAVRQGRTGRRADLLHWGLVPSWAKDRTIGNRMINARADTALEKPAFRIPLQKRRCLIPADVFFEWQEVTGQKRKQPWAVALLGGEIFAFGGLWDYWRPDEGAEGLVSCTILTTEPNALLEPIHDRMPVIVAPDDYDAWLAPTTAMEDVRRLLKPFDADRMRAWEVGLLVNDPKVDDARVIAPMA